MEKTFILGKDAPLEATIHHFQQRLQNLGFHIEEVSWQNPVPYVYSVHIRDKDCPLCFANGKGACKKSAFASALGEFLERLSSNYFFADFYLGKAIAQSEFVHYPNEKWFAIEDDCLPQGILDDKLLTHFDPDGELSPFDLVDLQSGNEERGIVALPYVRQRDGEVVYIPQAIVANLFVSNGMSAGNSLFEARVQGLAEIFERFVKNKIIREGISLPLIPAQIIASYPTIAQSLQALEEAGLPILAYDASLGGQYPVICVVLLQPKNGTCLASFGAHPCFEVALERTVTELLQGRSLNDLGDFSSPSFDDEGVATQENLETHFIDANGVIPWDLFKKEADYPFVHWDFSAPHTQGECENLLQLFHQAGKDVYIMDYCHLGVDACRIIVPTMSEIYPVEDLIYANHNKGARWRELLLSLPTTSYSKSDYKKLLAELEDEDVEDGLRVREFIGVAVDAGSPWATLRIGELKGLLSLACGDLAEALMWVEWTLAMNESVLSEKNAHFYRTLQQSLALFLAEKRDPAQYRAIFEQFYGRSCVAKVWGMIQGANPFSHWQDEGKMGFQMQQKLIEAYEKLQQAKCHPMR